MFSRFTQQSQAQTAQAPPARRPRKVSFTGAPPVQIPSQPTPSTSRKNQPRVMESELEVNKNWPLPASVDASLLRAIYPLVNESGSTSQQPQLRPDEQALSASDEERDRNKYWPHPNPKYIQRSRSQGPSREPAQRARSAAPVSQKSSKRPSLHPREVADTPIASDHPPLSGQGLASPGRL